MKLLLEDLEFDAAVELAAVLFVVVGSQRFALPVTNCLDASGVNALFCKEVLDSLRAVLR